MDIPEDKINFKSLLQRLMVEFVKDEEKRNEERRIEIERKQKEERDRQKEEREKRKQEALERYAPSGSCSGPALAPPFTIFRRFGYAAYR